MPNPNPLVPVRDGCGVYTQDDLYRGLLSSRSGWFIQQRFGLDSSDRGDESCSLAASVPATASVDHSSLDNLDHGCFGDTSWDSGLDLRVDLLLRRG